MSLILTSSSYVYANDQEYDCIIDDKMRCEPGSDPEPNTTRSDPEPNPTRSDPAPDSDGDQESEDESPR
jgi:hypothetical protein